MTARARILALLSEGPATIEEITGKLGIKRILAQAHMASLKAKGMATFRSDVGAWVATGGQKKKKATTVIRMQSKTSVLIQNAIHDIDEHEYPEAVVLLVHHIAHGVSREDDAVLREIIGMGDPQDERIKVFLWLAVELGKMGWFKTTKEVKGKRRRKPVAG